MNTVNPSTGEILRTYETMPREVVDARIAAAQEAFVAWASTPMDARTKRLLLLAEVLRARKRALAEQMAVEMGKPIRDGIKEIEKCAIACEYYAEHAARFLASEMVETGASKSYVAYRPLGVVLAIMPWNFPFWQVIRFAAPGLVAGNVALLKHASNVPGCAMALESVFDEAGFPKGVFASLLVANAEAEKLVEHPSIAAVTLTGSVRAGKTVAAAAGRAIKKIVLELGGSDPYLVLEDADLDWAADRCVEGRLVNAGQSCIAAKRFVVVESVRSAFEAKVVERMRQVRVGDPLDEETEMGPLARVDLRNDVHDQVVASIQRGATLLLGGEVPEGPGAFYPPTVLTNVRPGMPAYEEEIFGPVAAILPVRDEAEGITVANDTRFGLGAGVFTQDVARGERIALFALEAGACFVNDYVRSDPRLPFGGVKESGHGRELGCHGIREFVNVKTVWVR